MNFTTSLVATSTLLSTSFSATALAAKTQVIDWERFNSSVLIEVSRANKVFTSSAVIIAPKVLLTAAHCVENIDTGKVHLGHDYSHQNKKIDFKKVIIHNGYNSKISNFKDDIAIVILKENLPANITPVKLSKAASLKTTVVDRIGFGHREGKNNRTWTNPQVVEQVEDTLILKDQLSVIGDSGGPIYKNEQLLAIHSTLEGSDKTYAVYVPNYLDWIYRYLPKNMIENQKSSSIQR